MLEMVAPEASYVKISGQVFQIHDLQVGGKPVSPTPSPGRALRGSWTDLGGLGRVSGGPWGVLEWSLDGLGDALSES